MSISTPVASAKESTSPADLVTKPIPRGALMSHQSQQKAGPPKINHTISNPYHTIVIYYISDILYSDDMMSETLTFRDGLLAAAAAFSCWPVICEQLQILH